MQIHLNLPQKTAKTKNALERVTSSFSFKKMKVPVKMFKNMANTAFEKKVSV